MINNLQALRAFAAINVALYHIIDLSITYLRPAQDILFLKGWGANGVDIFFVISGFIILYSQFARKKDSAEFVQSRVIRIVPLYWFLSSLLVIGFIVFPSAFRNLEVTPKLVVSSFLFCSKLFGEKYPIINVGWTLEFEVIFYIVFGISLLFRTLKISVLFTSLCVATIALVSSSWIFFEFIFGMLIAIIHAKYIVTQRLGACFLVIGGVLLIVSISAYVKGIELNRLIVWGFPSFMIVLGAVSTKQLTSKFIIHLGNASYSIYLVHFATASIFYKTIDHFNMQLNSVLLSLLSLVITVVAGSFTHIFLEKPLIKYLRGANKRSNTVKAC